jgi:hypothetical protein
LTPQFKEKGAADEQVYEIIAGIMALSISHNVGYTAHPRQIRFVPDVTILAGMVGSPHRAQIADGSILARGGISHAASVMTKSWSIGVSSTSQVF